MSSSTPPAGSGGGNAKFVVIGILLLLGGGGAIYMLTRSPPGGSGTTNQNTPPPARDASVPSLTPSVGVEITLPQEEPDSGVVAEAPIDAGGPRIRYVYRYVNQCPGAVEPARVTAVIQQNYGGLRECYNRQLRTNPALQGRVTAQWIIQTNGTVGQISTSGSLARDRVFKSCFESTLSRLRFSPPRNGCAVFEQAFNFSPSN